MVPTPLIILPFLATFILCSWQYYRIDPKRRLLNARAGLMIIATASAFGYPIFLFYYPDAWRVSWGMFCISVASLATSYYLLRRMPPRETD
jgi:hypothetical protein